MIRRGLFALILAFALAARPARGDEVLLNDGRRIEGEVTDLGDRVKISGPLGAVYYDKSAVEKITRGKTTRQRYAEMEAVAGKDAASHFTLAEWCEEHGLRKEAKTEYEHALQCDPGHAEAHRRLGHVFHEGRWITQEEHNRARGLVLFKGEWITPEERDALEAVAAKKALEVKLRREVETLLDRMSAKNPAAREEAVKALELIPLDIRRPGLRGAMQHRDAGVRRYAAISLGADPEASDLDRFLRMALRDGEVDNSAVAFQVLSRMGRIEKQREAFLSGLTEREPLVVMRAAAALEVAGDESCVAALVMALERTFALASWGLQRGVISGGVTRGEEVTRGDFLDRERFKSGESLQVTTPVTGGVDPALLKGVRAAIQSALRKITGRSFGDNLPLWHWYVEEMRAKAAAREGAGSGLNPDR